MGVQLTAAQLQQLFPKLSAADARAFEAPLNAALVEFGIDTPLRVAAFGAQVGHESLDLTHWEERFDYSPERLITVFGARRFPSLAHARRYAGHPEAIANYVYAYRLGNGSEASGHGYKYRGGGPMQLTGFENHTACGRALGLPLLEHPELLRDRRAPGPGFRSAGWFWLTRTCNEPADRGQFEIVTRRINGGLNGHLDRLARYERAKAVLGVR